MSDSREGQVIDSPRSTPDTDQPMKLPISTLRKDLILILVDKLAIGLIVLVAALFANKVLESYKSDQAFDRLVAETRVQKIAEVWGELYRWEAVANELIEKGGRTILVKHGHMKPEFGWSEESLEQRVTELAKRSQEMRLAFLDLIEKNRFWIGEAYYNATLKYYNFNQDRVKLFFSIVETDDKDELDNIRQQFEKITEKRDKAKDSILGIASKL